MEFLLQTQESFGGALEALSFDFQLIKLEIGMCFCRSIFKCVSVNGSVAFEFLTQNPKLGTLLFSFLDTFREGIKGIRVRYAELTTLLSIFKGTLHQN